MAMQEILEWLDSKRSYDAGVRLYQKYGKDPLLHRLFQEDYSEFKLKRLHQALEQLASGLPTKKTIVAKVPDPPKPAGGISEVIYVPASEINDIKKQVNYLAEEKEDLQYQVGDLEDTQYDLQKQVAAIDADQDKLKEDVAKLKIAQKSAPRGWPVDMDETVRSLHDQWHPLFVEKKSLQARIYDVALTGQKDPAKKKEAGAIAHRILDLRDACRNIYKRRDYYLVHGKVLEEPKLIDIPEDPKKWPLTLQNYQRYLRDYNNKLKKLSQTEANKSKLEDIQKQIAKYQWGINEIKKLLGL